MCDKEQIIIDNISAGYGDQMVLENISFTIKKNDFIGIAGPNGGGKTSLLKVILGLLKPVKGEIIYTDKNVKNNIGYIPQANTIDKRFPIMVSEVIQSGLCRSNESKKKKRERVNEIATEMGIHNLLSKGIGELSGGQLQKVLISRALICRPGLLILDEPNSFIDQKFETFLYNLLVQINQDTTIIMVSHEIEKLNSIAKKTYYINKNIIGTREKNYI